MNMNTEDSRSTAVPASNRNRNTNTNKRESGEAPFTSLLDQLVSSPPPKKSEGIYDYVEESTLTDDHFVEMDAQGHAVDDYYENEDKICCHWDRISAFDLAARMDYPSGVVLDLGCGTGSAGGAIRKAGAKVIGADLSVACLVAAKRRLDDVVRADAATLPFKDGVFDGLVSRGALHHLHDPETALKEAARVLKPGAPVLFLDPREFAWLEPIKDRLRQDDHSFSDDHHAYSIAEYEALIAREFVVEETFTEHPLGVLLAAGLDLLPLPAMLPKRWLALGLYQMDTRLNQTMLSRLGHLLVVRARRR